MNRGIKVLQTCALPLGHGAVEFTLYYYSRDFYVCQEGKTFFDNFIIFAYLAPYYGMKKAMECACLHLTFSFCCARMNLEGPGFREIYISLEVDYGI